MARESRSTQAAARALKLHPKLRYRWQREALPALPANPREAAEVRGSCAPNRLRDQPKPTKPNQLWVSYITYLMLASGQWAYLCAFQDAYDINKVLEAIGRCHAHAVIRPQTNRLDQRAYDQNLYADRNRVERFFGRLKEARGCATRYNQNGYFFFSRGPPTGCIRLATLTVRTR